MHTDHGHSPAEIEDRLNAPNKVSHIRDMIYGGIDGAVTTFAIVAGVQGAGLNPSVIIALGIANVLADGFSMAAGNYSGTKADLDNMQRLRVVEERHIDKFPEGEREEIRQILAGKGLSGDVLNQATDAICSDRTTWIDMMMTEEYGLSPSEPQPMIAALATFGAFLFAGAIPLIPFIFAMQDAFLTAAIATAIVFFGIGAAKSRWSLAPWWRSALETLAIGSLAAGIAYGVGSLFHV